jgi:PAS domain S-box-containing protein
MKLVPGSRLDADGRQTTALLAVLPPEHPAPLTLDRLAHEYALRDELDGAWAVRPLEFVREDGRTLLVFEDPGGESLDDLLGAPMELGCFLRLAIGVATALGRLHQRGLIHKDLKPDHILVNCVDGEVRLTGFGIATQLRRERKALEPPETIAGTLAYMAPEQTGRMNRSIDSRSDLYALGVTFYQMLVGALPFTASDPLGWIHCHIARQPLPPAMRLETVPVAVSQITMKLLAKAAEDRYQSAVGLEMDLRHCLTAWEAERRIDEFTLGEHDVPDRLFIPEKLYGRKREVEILLAAFERVVKGGAPELVLVSGYSGIGKSSVVNDLHKVLVPPRGLFAVGKFDQYKRDIPYSTLVQAFQSLVRQLLGKNDAELMTWRSSFLEALGPNARLITDLVPELKLIIGDQPPVPELPPQQAHGRFQLLLRRFIGVFARPDHPLALFLDDLQWLDAATLGLLEDLLTQSDLQHLILIGAYRDNEVDAAHSLTHTLSEIRQAGAKVQEIRLTPLKRVDLEHLIADALRCTPSNVAPLAQLVLQKTDGNPFFVMQFLHALADEDLLSFDHDAGCWRWDLDRIHAKRYTENVVDFMVGKLYRLPAETQQAVRLLACLGNIAPITMLSICLGADEEKVHAVLWPATREEVVEHLDSSYKFTHDRVHEAAYSLIPEASRAGTHLRIGRLLVAQTPSSEREEVIFEIVNQLNRSAALITDIEERVQLAELNLLAGKRAKSSTAYASALTYLDTGAALLAEDCWERQRELTFALELNRAECEYLTGRSSVAEERLTILSKHASTTVEQTIVVCLQMDVCTVLHQADRAVAVCLDYLLHFGIAWSPHPKEEEVRREYERIGSLVGSRAIENLVDLPLMEDETCLATVQVLSKLLYASVFIDANLRSLTVCKAVSLSVEHGHCDGSCVAYVTLARIAGPCFGDYQTGFRFGQLGYDLVERRGLKRFEASTYTSFALFVVPWTKHVQACSDLLHRAFEAANRIGDLIFAAYALYTLCSALLFAGKPLSEVQIESEHDVALAVKARFVFMIDNTSTRLALIRMLRGLTPKFGCLDNGQFEETRIEEHLSSTPVLQATACFYWVKKLQACYIASDYATANDAASKAKPLLWTVTALFEEAEYHFYAALSRAASADYAPPDERQQHIDAIAAHHGQLQTWANNCPENFKNRAALVGAELARLEDRMLDAEHLYEEAIQSSRDHGFIHTEAIAYERASAFYRARGFDQVADLYLRSARCGYIRWGADGKVRQLEAMYPKLGTEDPTLDSTNTIDASIEHLDLATVIKVSQVISGEIVLEKLIDTLMRNAIENAGAERGLLILSNGAQRIAAEATIIDETIVVRLCDAPVAAATLSESVLHYALRVRESVILDDAASHAPFNADPYIRARQVRSILCLPLLNRSKLVGALYLENSLTSRAFAPARIAVLKLIASQAAISLENTRLYRDLAEREAKIRRLIEANIIGIFFWEIEGRIVEANDAFLRMLGYDREDLATGRLHWMELTPPEWLERDLQHWRPMHKMTGTLQPFEKEYFRKDGSRVPVLIGVANFDESGNQGVAFVLDLSERKLAETKARDVQTELAHANRVAIMGQLTSSIAHEVNQPIAASRNNAAAALRFLSAKPPHLAEVREALDCIVESSYRAEHIIDRIRAHIKKTLPQSTCFDINDVINDLIALVRSEVNEKGVITRFRLWNGLPLVRGDRIQLQQVVLNLVLNAVEAMSLLDDSHRELLISTEPKGANEILVSVRDSGPGIDPMHIESVFDSFYTTKPNGMGLGLSICRSIVDTHGGRLWADANEPRGAVFHFTVPSAHDDS